MGIGFAWYLTIYKKLDCADFPKTIAKAFKVTQCDPALLAVICRIFIKPNACIQFKYRKHYTFPCLKIESISDRYSVVRSGYETVHSNAVQCLYIN